jgi:TAG lipase/steryl ester hydrolase/phospholipase A2/LPA acyltransferase
MSLLTDTIFSGGSTRLHVGEKKNGVKSLRKSKSHGGLLAPLVQLARNPIGALHNAIGNQLSVPETATHAADADGRRQILYLRMNNVGTWHWVVGTITC